MIKKFYTHKYDKAFKEIMMKRENFNILKKVLETILNIEITNIYQNEVVVGKNYDKDEEMTKNIQIRRAKEDGISDGIYTCKKELINTMLKNGITLEKYQK